MAAAFSSAPHLIAAACDPGDPGYCAPDQGAFVFKPLFSFHLGSVDFAVTKLTALLFLGIFAVIVFFVSSTRRMQVVPTKRQWLAEEVYGFVRNGVAGDVIGEDQAKRFGPYLASLFCFVLILNFFEVVPIAQVPVTGRIALPVVLALISWAMFNYIGIRQHGFGPYMKGILFPPGVPKLLYILLTPIEFFSTLVVRPFTLAIRLFANMFAGHLLLLVFTTGAVYLFNVGGASYLFGSVSFLMTLLLTFFELLVEVLQAYIFVILTAIYIQGALAEEH